MRAILASLAVSGALCAAQLVQHRYPLQTVWPMPKEMKVDASAGPVYISGDFQVDCQGLCADPITDALFRFQQNVFVNGTPSAVPSPALSKCTMNVYKDEPLALGTNESYTLSISSSGCTITAPNQWGALYSLEVLSQLIFWTPEENTYSVRNGSVTINDEPRFPWRGLMIDTARHYLTPDSIRQTIMAMAANRMNTLHVHVVE